MNLFDFLSLKNDVNVLSKSNKQKNLFHKISVNNVGILKVNDENSRIRIQDPDPDPLVRSMDPDPPQNVMDPEHWFLGIILKVLRLEVSVWIS